MKKVKMLKCLEHGLYTPVEVDPEYPEKAYYDPLGHGVCPECGKPLEEVEVEGDDYICCGCPFEIDPNHDIGECSLAFMAPGVGLEEKEVTPYGIKDEYGGL